MNIKSIVLGFIVIINSQLSLATMLDCTAISGDKNVKLIVAFDGSSVEMGGKSYIVGENLAEIPTIFDHGLSVALYDKIDGQFNITRLTLNLVKGKCIGDLSTVVKNAKPVKIADVNCN